MVDLPINGTASDVEGIFSATKLRKTVSESNIVTPFLIQEREREINSLKGKLEKKLKKDADKA